ncbi:hypothetical protein [Nonomuraea sp. NPDC048916]
MLIGATTMRRDNPRLLVNSEAGEPGGPPRAFPRTRSK